MDSNITAPITEAPRLKPRNLTAYELSSYAKAPGAATFSVDRYATAKFLREMADCFETGEYLIQEGSLLQRVTRDEYALSYLTLVFHQKTEMTTEQQEEQRKINEERTKSE